MPQYKLIQGNCTEVMTNLVGNMEVDVIITDPPYGIRYKSNLQRGNRRSGAHVTVRDHDYFKPILNDDQIRVDWLPHAYNLLKTGGAIYIFIHWRSWSMYEEAVKRAGFIVKNMLVINKSNHGMGDLSGDYAPKHELVMFATKGRHLLNQDRGRRPNVFDLPVKYSGTRRYHPNEKPVSWITPFIEESTESGDLILDCFMGSGTTGVAALKSNRNFIGIELDESCFNIADDRIGRTVPHLFRASYQLELPKNIPFKV